MTRPSALKQICAISLFCLALTAGVMAQTFTTLLNFNGTNGEGPYLTSLIQGTDGDLYGVTFNGGVSATCQALGISEGCGTIFKMTPGGTLTTIYNFCQQSGCTDGYLPMGITLSSNGSFYGTTYAGGANGQGTIFRITSGGILTTLYSFCSQSNCADGVIPLAGLIQATDGNWYGTTFGGGNSACSTYYGCGTVFRMSPAGQFMTLYTFPSGGHPAGELIQGRDGSLYGTATGDAGVSTIFKISLSGAFTILHQFDSAADVYDGLVQGTDGNFYGTTALGGNVTKCDLYGCGTVFKITPSGTLTTIYNFCSAANCADGAIPFSPLVQATDGNFYGMTNGDGYGPGTAFSISPAGILRTLQSFDGTNGAGSYCGFLQGTNGVLYGMTTYGGPTNAGLIFSLNAGLAHFVTFVRSFGKVGATVEVLGQGFTGTTAVSFNGTPPTYSVKSDTYLTVTVPSGATTGFVSVTTPSAMLRSNRQFQVKP